MRKFLNQYPKAAPNILALGGAIAYFLQSKIHAATQLSVLDEGAYLLKGYWFASGQYILYQDFGPFTNHMPFAFMIPGYIQAWFGPGLGVARTFAIFIGLLFILGLWLLSRRWGGNCWAAAAVWAIALNPALIKIYSVGVSQGLVVAMLVWTLYFALGPQRPFWQIALGMALSAVIALTRLNMTPVLFLLILYIFWEHGRDRGIRAALIGLGFWGLGHALYWPGILQMWANYTPRFLFPFLDQWRIPAEAIPSWTSGTSLHGRWLSLLETLRFHFVSLVAAIFAWLMWPARKAWRSAGERRAAVFLAYLFALLLLMHAIASLGADYCVFCFPLYSAFYSVLGIILLMVVWPSRPSVLSAPGRKLSTALVLILPMLVAYGSYSLFSSSFPLRKWVRSIMNADVPRVSGLSLQSGTLPFWGLLENAYGHSYAEAFRVVQIVLAYSLLLLMGLLFGLALIWIARRLHKWLPNLAILKTEGYGQSAFLLLLLMGLVFSPTPWLGGGYQTYDCDQNIIQAYEQLAANLAEITQPGDLVFWRGGRSAIPLLYMEDVRTFPAQLNGDYTYRLGGGAEQLERAGLWGPALLEEWLQQAELIMVEKDLYRTWLQAALEEGSYVLRAETAPLSDCSPRSEIMIYQFQP